ncbi:site-specific integrase [Virgisporangium aliadipatigenens]|uniref:Site-specific integrase n=1 Tax=Virgisporangium aliadipatigenens TaxID=741659 RepID=A0A8J3YSM8_9ACTN|nr:site-specific integrase [Virgisporangium aliadipatigenens]GIJ49747.1 site-specific integrase [Virgisporangium aliadipatigenens]
MDGTTYKRCGCRDTNRKRLGQSCPKLRRGNGWNPNHGVWQYQIELPAAADGRRRPLRRGTYATQTEAQDILDKIRNALSVAKTDDPTDLTKTGDMIETAVQAEKPIPTPTEVRRRLHLGNIGEIPTVEAYLTSWLAGRKKLRKGTRRSYAGHITNHLIPHLGTIRLDRLRVSHLDAMFDAIDERNDLITTMRASREPANRDMVKGKRTIGPATMHRIRATLRAALNTAISRDGLIDTNPAKHVELPPAVRPKPLVWTDERVDAWKTTGTRPGKVMVWTPAQTGAFLDHAHAANDPYYALYHLIAYRGLRRGEACGLHWTDLDLTGQQMAIRWQITQHGWATALEAPKTDDSDAVVALDAATVDALTAHRARQRRYRLAAGPAWVHTGLVFTTPTGAALHPADVTDHFQFLVRQAGLPPVRLHDLRHGAATLALAAGVDMKVVQAMLRHSSITVTADTYTSVLPDLARTAAEKTAAIVPRRTTTVPIERRAAG